MDDVNARRSMEPPTVELGVAGLRVPVHSHIGCLWETEEAFTSAVGFLAAGFRGSDHGVVFGTDDETGKVLTILAGRGIDTDSLRARNRLTLVRPHPSGRPMLERITSVFEAAKDDGAPLVRLFGNVGWTRDSWPPDAEILTFEALLTTLAERFDSVLLCLHRLPSITSPILRHGVLGTHPQILEPRGLRQNPLFEPFANTPERLAAASSVLANLQEGREAIRRETEVLRAIFASIPVMISLRDADGRILLVNREWEHLLGWTLEEAQQSDIMADAYPDPAVRRAVIESVQRADRVWTDFTTRTRDGRTIETSWARVALSDGMRLGFGYDITERKRAEEALRLSEERYRESSKELRALSERLRVIREEERTRMAREVHDEIGQALTALHIDAAWLERRLAASTDRRTELQAKVRSMSALIDTTLDTVQRIATELRPGVLDELGLEAAIEWYLREFEERTGIECRFRPDLGAHPQNPARSTAVFRILQEALTNVARHAGATRVRIHLASDAEGLRLEIRDNGRGIAADRIDSSSSLGLVGMRERARALGGDVEIRGVLGRGTTVALTFPT